MRLFTDIKTEALLIYINTLCIDYIKKIENNDYKIDIGNDSYNKEITDTIYSLKDLLSKSIYNAYELKSFVNSYIKASKNKKLPLQYETLLYYYNTIVSEFDKTFKAGDIWIPEQVIFSLLSEWIYEEEKSVKRYPYLQEIDYIKLLSYFENARNNDTDENKMKDGMRLMYKTSSNVIEKLKQAKLKKTKPKRKK